MTRAERRVLVVVATVALDVGADIEENITKTADTFEISITESEMASLCREAVDTHREVK